MYIGNVCNKEKMPEDKVINPNSILIIIGLLNLINKSRNTINEKTKIEKYNLVTNSIKKCGYEFETNVLFYIDYKLLNINYLYKELLISDYKEIFIFGRRI